jgi:divalent metal cation (Fe/Co/Zn/Cd) transporter
LVCKAELSVRLKSLVFDAISLIALVLLHFFSAFKPMWYLSPVVCILLSLYLIVGTVNRMRGASREVLDKTANEDVQMAILHALTTKYDNFVSFDGVDTRVSGGVVYVDLRIGFSDDTTAVEIRRFVNEVHTEILDRVPDCRVAVSIASTVSCAEEE